VTGLDLVALQIRIAAGEAIPFEQQDVRLSGHAIEARIYAEDPDAGFVPSPGPILAWQAPEGPGIRLDAGFDAGMTVTPYYDAMLAKLIAHGRDRAEALERLAAALDRFWIAGIKTGIPFLRRLVETPTFRAGAYDTGFLEAEMARSGSTLAPPRAPEGAVRAAVLGVAAWRASVDGAGAGDGLEAVPAGASRTVRVTLPKQEGVDVEVMVAGSASPAASKPIRLGVVVEGRRSELVLEAADEPHRSAAEGVVLDARIDGAPLRLSVVRKKPGEYELGLRDRVLRARTELRS